MFAKQFFRNQPDTLMDIHDDSEAFDNINDFHHHHHQTHQQKQHKKQRRNMLQTRLHIKIHQSENKKSNDDTMITSCAELQPITSARLSTLIPPSKSPLRSAFMPISEAKEDPHNQTLKRPTQRLLKRSKSLDFTLNDNSNTDNQVENQISRGSSIGSITSNLFTSYKTNSGYFFKKSSKRSSSTKKAQKRLNKSLPPIPSLSSVSLNQSQKNYEISQYLNAASDPSAYTTKPLRVRTIINTSPVSESHELAPYAQSLPMAPGYYFSHFHSGPTTPITNTMPDCASPLAPSPRLITEFSQEQKQREQQSLATLSKSDLLQPAIDTNKQTMPPAIPPRSASRGRQYKSKALDCELGNNMAGSSAATPGTVIDSSCRDSMSTQSRNNDFSCNNNQREQSLGFEPYQSIVSPSNAYGAFTGNTAINPNFEYKHFNSAMTTTNISEYTSNDDTFLDLHDRNINTNPITIPKRKSYINSYSSRNSTIAHHGRNPTLLRNFINEDLSVFDSGADVDLSPSFAPPDKKTFLELETNSAYCSSVHSSTSLPSLSLSTSLSETESEKQIDKKKSPKKQQQEQQHQQKESKEKMSRLNLLTRFIYRKKTVDSNAS